MKFVRTIILLMLCSSSHFLFSQTETVKMKLTVTDSYTNKTLAGVSIINPKSSTTLATDGKGYLEEMINKSDTLFLFFPSYRAIRFSVADSAPKKEYVLHLMLEPFSTGISRDIIIKAPKTLEQIETERRKLGITPKELEKPAVSFMNPISAFYEMLSRHAKEREKLKTQIAENDKDKVFKELLNYYNEKKLIDLPEDHYDNFIRFCNLPTEFLKNHTDYEIMKTVKTFYDKYAKLSGLVK